MKDKLSRQLCVMALVLLSGIVFGCCFISERLQFLTDTVSIARWFAPDAEAVKLYSGFVFDFAAYLLLLFIFGLTVLGTVFVPAIIFLKGTALGITFTWLFGTIGTVEYIKSWLIFGSAAFCMVFMLLFALHALRVSLKLCRHLNSANDITLHLRKFGIHFIFTFLMTAILGGTYLLSVFCGNLL